MAAEPALLDSDTLSELCRGNLRVRDRAAAYLREFGRLTTSAVTIFERLRGYELAIRNGKPFERHRAAFLALAATCLVLPFDGEAAAIAARIWSSVTRARRQHLGDILIAAIAASRELPLVTRNRSDFEDLARSSGVSLQLRDWTTGSPVR